MKSKLPIRLQKEPLIDAIFEFRYLSTAPTSNIFPGFFFSKLGGDKIVDRLPAAELPKPIRDADVNLQFAPLLRLSWNEFVILIGDRSLAVGCKLPYPGWTKFKPAILQIVQIAGEVGIIQTIDRFSMKYIDLIPSSDPGEQVSLVDLSLMVGEHTLRREPFSIRVEIPRDGLLNAVQIASCAIATMQDGTTREGVIVDTDTIANVKEVRFEEWLVQLPESLERMHTINKALFFECLRPETVALLEPVYE